VIRSTVIFLPDNTDKLHYEQIGGVAL